jgi:hypothetical protein
MKVKKYLPEILAGLSILMTLLVIVQFRTIHGIWFDFHEAWHHESLEVCFLSFAAGLLLGKYLTPGKSINRRVEFIAGVAVLCAVLLPVHQKLSNGYWFAYTSMIARMSVEAYFLLLAAGLLLGKYIGKRRG